MEDSLTLPKGTHDEHSRTHDKVRRMREALDGARNDHLEECALRASIACAVRRPLRTIPSLRCSTTSQSGCPGGPACRTTSDLSGARAPERAGSGLAIATTQGLCGHVLCVIIPPDLPRLGRKSCGCLRDARDRGRWLRRWSCWMEVLDASARRCLMVPASRQRSGVGKARQTRSRFLPLDHVNTESSHT